MIDSNKLFSKKPNLELLDVTVNSLPKHIMIEKETKYNTTVHKIFKLIKHACNQMDRQKQKLISTQMILIEWKELAKRIDYLMFFFALFSICVTPVILFSKFFVRDLVTESHLSATCGCEHSFVKNV